MRSSSFVDVIRMLLLFDRRRRQQWRSITFIKIILPILFILWAIGVLDHAAEVPFSYFEWPPFTDVRHQVDLELAGLPATRLYENDWTSFSAKWLPQCDDEGARKNLSTTENFVLILVKSSAQNLANRAAIRRTWGAVQKFMGFEIRTVFVVADLEPRARRKMGNVLGKESDQYEDLLIGDYLDTYRNNTLKFLSAIQFAFSYCSRSENTVPYALLIDDDYFVSIKNLIAEIRKHSPAKDLYMGWRFDSGPFRLRFHKHRLSLNEYPFNRFPPYISAGAVLLSRATIRQFYYAIQHVRLFKFDDIYAGIIANMLGIPAIHNSEMRYWKFDGSAEQLNGLICSHGFPSQQLIQFYESFSKKKQSQWNNV